MNTGKDYDLSREYQNRQQAATARQQQIADIQGEDSQNRSFPVRRMVIFVAIGIAALLLLALPQGAQAQASRVLTDPGGSVSPGIEVALIIGDYYFDHGKYDEAITQFQIAIDGMPEILYELMPEHSIIFWQLGEAQAQAGLFEEALVSYKRFLELAGTGVTDGALAHVLAFEQNLMSLDT